MAHSENPKYIFDDIIAKSSDIRPHQDNLKKIYDKELLKDTHYGEIILVFNQLLNVGDLNGVTKLEFGYLFNQPLSVGILPDKLLYLNLGSKFNHPIDIGVLPNSLLYLDLGSEFNRLLDIGTLPKSLLYLDLGFEFNNFIGSGILPNSITHLNISYEFNDIIKIGDLPDSLFVICFTKNYAQIIGENVLPKSVKFIKIHKFLLHKSYIDDESIIKEYYDCDEDEKYSIEMKYPGIGKYKDKGKKDSIEMKYYSIDKYKDKGKKDSIHDIKKKYDDDIYDGIGHDDGDSDDDDDDDDDDKLLKTGVVVNKDDKIVPSILIDHKDTGITLCEIEKIIESDIDIISKFNIILENKYPINDVLGYDMLSIIELFINYIDIKDMLSKSENTKNKNIILNEVDRIIESNKTKKPFSLDTSKEKFVNSHVYPTELYEIFIDFATKQGELFNYKFYHKFIVELFELKPIELKNYELGNFSLITYNLCSESIYGRKEPKIDTKTYNTTAKTYATTAKTYGTTTTYGTDPKRSISDIFYDKKRSDMRKLNRWRINANTESFQMKTFDSYYIIHGQMKIAGSKSELKYYNMFNRLKITFNQKLNVGDLSENVVEIIFEARYNEIINLNILPQSLKKLSFRSAFNHLLLINSLPDSLICLSLSNRYNYVITKGVLPKNLKYLRLGYDFNQKLIKGSLPDTLIYLDLGSEYNHKIEKGVLPSSLKYLKLGNKFNHFIEPGVLPDSITHLEMSYEFNQIINIYTLPKSLIEIYFSPKFLKYIPINSLPLSVKHIKIKKELLTYLYVNNKSITKEYI
jgi:hypothetical protein